MIARLLARVGLVTPEQRAWAWYDWANSVYFTTVITAVFPSFLRHLRRQRVSSRRRPPRVSRSSPRSRSRVVAIMAPILGALADYSGIKKRLLAIFMMHRRRRRAR